MTLLSFPEMIRGDWCLLFSASTYKENLTIMLCAFNFHTEQTIIRYFLSKDDVEDFVERLVWDDDQRFTY